VVVCPHAGGVDDRLVRGGEAGVALLRDAALHAGAATAHRPAAGRRRSRLPRDPPRRPCSRPASSSSHLPRWMASPPSMRRPTACRASAPRCTSTGWTAPLALPRPPRTSRSWASGRAHCSTAMAALTRPPAPARRSLHRATLTITPPRPRRLRSTTAMRRPGGASTGGMDSERAVVSGRASAADVVSRIIIHTCM